MSVGDKVFTSIFMQFFTSLSLQWPLSSILATDTLPVCAHTTVMMPEPIHTIIVDNRRDSNMSVVFLINLAAKLDNYL